MTKIDPTTVLTGDNDSETAPEPSEDIFFSSLWKTTGNKTAGGWDGAEDGLSQESKLFFPVVFFFSPLELIDSGFVISVR